ncbi:glycoside hydrolase family 73 protein [Paenibacillus eucommiae]|uniref:Flagellum-specific peptidoglycan hydrolase FlgJ n=1 Tax=Paenibacillus eucommiae TaxID=1355755 RepID=A0ABS4J2F7_9BACL|nr:glycoside hydrolase family 73 protein [Paenibacillus eucommiae]MBP1993990.1 flagellum-specific peptidoglycan hydrolase FlgJ [Paenibacillus eucommiae]
MNKQAFLSAIGPAAQKDMAASGILASVSIAQAILESGWGSSASGNNLFGIKGTGQRLTTSEYINGEWVRIVDGFRVYDSWLDSIRDHSRLLQMNPRYAAVIGERNYIKASQALQYAGYATDPSYAAKLIIIIEQNGLTKYDKAVIKEDKEEDSYMMKPQDANKIIAFLSAAWGSTENASARKEFNRLANELRKASGQKVE